MTTAHDDFARSAASAFNRRDLEAMLALVSEDFAFFLEKVPGCYINIGNGIGSVGGCMVHNPGYDFNDHNVAVGSAYWSLLVERFLPAQG